MFIFEAKKPLILKSVPVNFTSLHFMKVILLPNLQGVGFLGQKKVDFGRKVNFEHNSST